MAPGASDRDGPGFDGELMGLGLADVIQLNVQIRLTGAISIRSGQRVGFVFMSEGQIVHAEQADLLGEAAFYEIMSWRGGCFAVKPNVVTARCTIQQTCSYLLLEACRVVDERRRGRAGKGVGK